MKYTFGLIGAGNMGGAIAKAVSRTLKDGVLGDRDRARAESLAAELGFTAVSQEEAAKECRYLFLGVKPHLLQGMLEGIRDVLEANGNFSESVAIIDAILEQVIEEEE